MNKIELMTHLFSLLSDEQKEKDILELNSNNKNKRIIEFLQSVGSLEIDYKMKNEKHHYGKIVEREGKTYVWYENNESVWIVKNWEIKRFLK